jgi:hypothetical protein
VRSCTAPGPLRAAPTTDAATRAVVDTCADHSMPGCEKCPSRARCPRPLEALGAICADMPGMQACSPLWALCDEAGGAALGEICAPATESTLPPMKMWMHGGISDIILFKEWVPTTAGAYTGAIIAVIATGLLVQLLRGVRVRTEAAWAWEGRVNCCDPGCGGAAAAAKGESGEEGEGGAGGGAGGSCCGPRPPAPAPPRACCGGGADAAAPAGGSSDGGSSSSLVAPLVRDVPLAPRRTPRLPTRGQLRRNAVRAALTVVVVTLDYALMLVVMTFNIGLVVAAIAGFGAGALAFGHMGEREGGGTALAVSQDHEADLEVRFVEPQCCGGVQV